MFRGDPGHAGIADEERPAHSAAVARNVAAVLLQEDADVRPHAAPPTEGAQGVGEVCRAAMDPQDDTIDEHQR